mgnify:CR=1 FL=1
MPNLSIFPVNETATTSSCIAHQRAENMFSFGRKNVIELCVGPSLKCLQKSYENFDIKVTGNDIEKRYEKSFSEGKWIIGDCFSFSFEKYDGIVFAPPLSRNCSGKREDSLCIDQVNPSYNKFLEKIKKDAKDKTYVLVLPGRSLSLKEDRKQFHKLLDNVLRRGYNLETVEMKCNKGITKYIDLYINI